MSDVAEGKIIRTGHMQTAAALLSQGDDWELASVTAAGRPGVFVFHVQVPVGQEARALEIVEKCRPGPAAALDVMVHLGRYEGAFQRLRRALGTMKRMTERQGAKDHGRDDDGAGRRAG